MPDPWPACRHCEDSMLVHQFVRGPALRCKNGYTDGFYLWDVVSLKRALGHKISPTLSHRSHMARIEWQQNEKRRIPGG